MAHTNQTPNYGLSEFLGTDKPAWLVDYNGDMEKIDLGLKAAKDVADAAKEEADQGAIDIAAVTLTANAADAKASEALSNMADVYDATSTYAVNDYVLYEGILYRCLTAITVPEPFTGSHWSRITWEEIITTLTTDVNELKQDEADIIISHTGRTRAQAMYSLMSALDYSKLRVNSKLLVGSSIFTMETIPSSPSGVLIFTQTEIFGVVMRTIQYTAGTNNNTCSMIDNNGFTDLSNSQATDDLYLFY
jgi:hypothetical protein